MVGYSGLDNFFFIFKVFFFLSQAVKNKEIDVKGAAELLGVSYGTLYGRYRELFGYVKHAWNTGGRPAKPGSSGTTSTAIAGGSSHFTKEPSGAIWTDPSNLETLEKLKTGQLSVKQAAEGLGIEPAVLAFQLIGQVILFMPNLLVFACSAAGSNYLNIKKNLIFNVLTLGTGHICQIFQRGNG